MHDQEYTVKLSHSELFALRLAMDSYIGDEDTLYHFVSKDSRHYEAATSSMQKLDDLWMGRDEDANHSV